MLRRLKQAVETGNISHAYVFEGDAAGNKRMVAEEFIKAVFCEESKEDSCGSCPSCHKIAHHNHEDLVYVEAEGGSIKDEAVEALQTRLKKKPYVGDRTAVIIADADTMTLRAQNRLLKTLEEPIPGTVIVLLSENIEHLVSTILSRCVVYRLSETEGANQGEEERERIRTLSKAAEQTAELVLSGAPFYQTADHLKGASADKESAVIFLDQLERYYRDLIIAGCDPTGRLMSTGSGGGEEERSAEKSAERGAELRRKSRRYEKETIYRAVEGVEEARRALNRNINIGYALKAMILKGETK